MRILLVFSLFFFSVVLTQSAPPCNAQVIPSVLGSVTEFGSTTSALVSTYTNCGISGNTAWYVVQPDSNSIITASTCSSYTDFDTVLGIFSGTNCTTLDCVTQNDDGCTNDQSTVTWTASESFYYIAVGGYHSNVGNFELTVTTTPGIDPSCSSAQVIPGPFSTPVSVFGDNLNVNTTTVNQCAFELGETYVSWYQINPTLNVQLLISTCSPHTDFDTKIGVFSGDCSSLNCVLENDDNCTLSDSNSSASTVVFIPTNSTYLIGVAGYSNQQGSFELIISQATDSAACTSAFPVVVGQTGNLAGSTSQGKFLEYSICSSEKGQAVWYAVTSPISQAVTFSTCNSQSNFDTFLSVYGGSCDNLTCINYSDDSCSTSDRLSTVTVDINANETVYLVISGYQGATGQYYITIST